MACPTCDHTMQSLLGGFRWCPRCGTLKQDIALSEHDQYTQPALTQVCREFLLTARTSSGGNVLGGHFRTFVDQALECCSLVDENPIPAVSAPGLNTAETAESAVGNLAIGLGMWMASSYLTPMQVQCYVESVCVLADAAGARDALRAFDSPGTHSYVQMVFASPDVQDDSEDRSS